MVGVGGLLTQGGISFLSAQYGLAADVRYMTDIAVTPLTTRQNIVSWEMVNWNGTIVNIDAETQPDLAVALRGSGSQFGKSIINRPSR